MNGQSGHGAPGRLEPGGRAGSHGLRPADVARLAITGLAGRPVRAVLSALGVALGVATMVAVLGLSASSRAQLVAEIDSLGTNMLTAQPSPLLGAQNVTLPAAAPAMAARIGPVISVGAVGAVSASIYKNDRIPAAGQVPFYGAEQARAGCLHADGFGVRGGDAVVLVDRGADGADRADGDDRPDPGGHDRSEGGQDGVLGAGQRAGLGG